MLELRGGKFEVTSLSLSLLTAAIGSGSEDVVRYPDIMPIKGPICSIMIPFKGFFSAYLIWPSIGNLLPKANGRPPDQISRQPEGKKPFKEIVSDEFQVCPFLVLMCMIEKVSGANDNDMTSSNC